jgi:hypothetical protein
MQAVKEDANEQAYMLQLSFERRAQLLRMVYDERLAIQYYEPEITKRLMPRTSAIAFKLSYRHFSHHIAPLRHRIFHHTEASKSPEIALSSCRMQVIRQLKEYQAGKEPDEQANTDALYQIRSYDECAKFLSRIYQERIAVTDYIPKIKYRENEDTGIISYSVQYRHKYFLSPQNQGEVFNCKSVEDNTIDNLHLSIDEVIAQVREYHRWLD